MAKEEENQKENKANEEVLSDSERIQEGQVLVRSIIEMLGAPKDHIEKTMKDYIESLGNKNDFEIIKKYISDAEKQEEDKMPKEVKGKGDLFSVYAELEIWFKDVEKLIEFCFDSMPSSIEILEPEEFKFKSNKFSGMLNDLQAKLHKLDMVYKSHNADIQAAGVRFKLLTTNFIGYCLKTGKNTVEDISEVIGVEKEKLQRILDDLTEKKVINKKDNTYSIE